MSAELQIKVRPTYGWVIILVAALAMVATLPGRTHGLGMITERLLADPAFGIDRTTYGDLNLWATLAGAAFCLPCGRLIDRYGVRITLTATVAALAAVVIWMTSLTGKWPLFAAILLTRGFGQSALSVISITMVGKWHRGRVGVPMAVYALLISLGFAGAALAAKPFAEADWRLLWSGMGWMLLVGMTPAAWFLARDPAVADGGAEQKVGALAGESPAALDGFSLPQAMRTGAFWAFGLAICVVAVITSGQSLFNESVLRQQGFAVSVYYDLMFLTTVVGLLVKLPVGWLAHCCRLGRLQAVGLLLMGGCLFWLPHIHVRWAITAYAVGMGVSGTIMAVLFFAVWAEAFGRVHLGEIQSAAQMLTVLASAAGPSLMARCLEQTGSYDLVFQVLAAASAVLALYSWLVWVPRPQDAPRLEQASPVTTPADTRDYGSLLRLP